jgi:hypothetical protein
MLFLYAAICYCRGLPLKTNSVYYCDTHHQYTRNTPDIADRVNWKSRQSLWRYEIPAIRQIPNENGIWYKIAIVVRHLLPTISMTGRKR